MSRGILLHIILQQINFFCHKKSGAYNRTSRPAVRPAKIYLARPLPAALLCLHRHRKIMFHLLHWLEPSSIPVSLQKRVPVLKREPVQKTSPSSRPASSSTPAPSVQATNCQSRNTIIRSPKNQRFYDCHENMN